MIWDEEFETLPREARASMLGIVIVNSPKVR